MLEIAKIDQVNVNVHEGPGQGNAAIPEGSIQANPEGSRQAKHREGFIPIKTEEWLEGPDGLMSLGDMLTTA
eukprot:6447617-Karenia_brevis.AAC.1